MRILCGGPVSEDIDIFHFHIKSLLAQGYDLDYKGIDNSPKPLNKPVGFKSVDWRVEPTMGEYKEHIKRWTKDRMLKLCEYREEMRTCALFGGYDYLFMVDSDLILCHQTLTQLLNADKDFISGLFWTDWKPYRKGGWPNAWYMGEKRHIRPDKKLLDLLKSGGVHQVGMTGACSLISKSALGKISYAPIKGVYGEDNCLAITARRAGIPLYIHADVKIEHRRRR